MEKQKAIKEFYEAIKEVPNAAELNSMTTTSHNIKLLWRPNNYRRQTKVKKKDNSVIQNIIHAIEPTKKGLNYNEHTKIISIKNYHPNITLQYGKETLTGIFKQNIIYGEKETYAIPTDNKKVFDSFLDKKKEEIRSRIDKAINHFSNRFKIGKNAIIKWARYEDWIKGEDYIDKIPTETIIHDTFFKKVYGEGMEFIQTPKKEEPTIHLKTYIKNQSIKEREPLIANEINNIYTTIHPTISSLNDSIQLEIVNKKLHLSVLKDMRKTLKDIRNDLKQKRLNDYM